MEEVRAVNVEQPEGDVTHTQADISQAREKLGYGPRVGFKQGTKDWGQWVARRKEKGVELR